MTDITTPRIVGLQGRLKPLAPENRFALKWANEYLIEDVAPTYPIDATEGLTDLGMQGNADWSDCVQAGEVHLEMTTAIAAGVSFTPDLGLAVERAKQFAGFVDPPGPGTNMPTYFQTLYEAGLILAWAPVDHTDPAGCQRLMAAGFGLLIGVSLFGGGANQPNQRQFANHEPFDVVPGLAPNPEEGHCVLWSYSETPTGPHKVGTWGAWQDTTDAWMSECLHQNPNGEAYLVVTTQEELAKFSPALLADVQRLGGQGPAAVEIPEPAPIPESVPTPAAESFVQRLEDALKRPIAEIVSLVEDAAAAVEKDIKEILDPVLGRTPQYNRHDVSQPPSPRN